MNLKNVVRLIVGKYEMPEETKSLLIGDVIDFAEAYAKEMCKKQRLADSIIAHKYEPDEMLSYVTYAS